MSEVYAYSDDQKVLCGASFYSKKFYLNDEFSGLPKSIRDELKITCVLFTEEMGGTIQFIFEDDGELTILTDANENDYNYDEIGSALKVKAMQREKAELFEQLEMYYKVFFLGEDAE